MELPRYPRTPPSPMPDESAARQSATALLACQAALLLVAIPVQVLLWLSLGLDTWDERLRDELFDVIPVSFGVGVVTAPVAGLAAHTVWRDLRSSVPWTALAALLVAVLSVCWFAALGDRLLEPLGGVVWVLMSVPALAAMPLVLVVRRRVRRDPLARTR